MVVFKQAQNGRSILSYLILPYCTLLTLTCDCTRTDIRGLASENPSGRKTLSPTISPSLKVEIWIVTRKKKIPLIHKLQRHITSFLQITLSLQLLLLFLLFTTIMCPTCSGDVVNGTRGDAPATTNGHANDTNGFGPHTPHNPRRQPFASVGDYLSNVSNFKIIESTLREGEQVSMDLRI